MDAATLESLITIATIAIAGIILIMALAACMASQSPGPQEEPATTYTRHGACRFSHHRKTIRK